MDDRATVDFWREAEVGDLIWHKDGNREVFDENGKYAGRGYFSLKTVVEITKKYIRIGEPGFLRDFDKTTGIARTVRDYAPPNDIFGEKEKWLDQNWRDVIRLMDTRDSAVRIRLAEAVGLTPPQSVNTVRTGLKKAVRT